LSDGNGSPNIVNKGFRSQLLVVMYIGAARADANPEQRLRLKEELLPIFRNQDAPYSQVLRDAVMKTKEIMGESWDPTGEWDDYIQSLLTWPASLLAEED
jgi:hypothetical protein